MLIHLHKQATTTPKARAAIQASDAPASALAERFGTTEQTVYKWKHRDSVDDRSHTPHRVQTTLTLAQEAAAVVLRKTLLVSLDDLLAVDNTIAGRTAALIMGRMAGAARGAVGLFLGSRAYHGHLGRE